MDANSESHLSYLYVVGKYRSDSLIETKNWSSIASCLDNLVAQSQYRMWLDSWQEDESENRIKYGRLSWSRKSFDKWTESGEISKKMRFRSLMMSCPSLNICDSLRTDPDVFFHLENDGLDEEGDRHRYDYSLLTCFSRKYYSESAITAATNNLTKTLNSISNMIFVAQKNGGWFTIEGNNSIAAQDYLIIGTPGREWLSKTPELSDLPASHNWKPYIESER